MSNNYFLIKIFLKEKLKINAKVKVILPKIMLFNEETNDKVFIKPKYKFEVQLNGQNILLYIKEENNISIEWFLNEEYEINLSQLKILYNEKYLEYTYECSDVIDEKNIKENFLNSFLNEELKEVSICFCGLRPQKLYGYNLNDSRYQKLAKKIRETLINEIEKSNIQICVTSCSLGMETVSFFVVDWLKNNGYNLINVLVIPFRNIFCKWSNTDKERFERMKEKADYIICVDEQKGYYNELTTIGNYHPLKLFTCSEFIINHSSKMICLWDKTTPEIKSSIDYATSKDVKCIMLHN